MKFTKHANAGELFGSSLLFTQGYHLFLTHDIGHLPGLSVAPCFDVPGWVPAIPHPLTTPQPHPMPRQGIGFFWRGTFSKVLGLFLKQWVSSGERIRTP